MPNEIIFLVEDSEDGGYEAKALGFSIYTEAETLDELKEAVRDAVQCHFEELELPKIIRLHVVEHKLCLGNLMTQVTKDNLHSEVDMGILTGRETW